MASRSSPDVRRASLLLSGLVLTGDDSLEAFRDRRVGDKSLDTAHLKRARDVLDAVHEAITAGDEGRWRRLEEAWQLLCNAGDAPAVGAKSPAPSPEPPVAEPEALTPEPKAPSGPEPPKPAPAVPAPAPPPPSRPGPAPPVAPPRAPVASPAASSTGPSPWARQDGAAPASQRQPPPAAASPPPPASQRQPPVSPAAASPPPPVSQQPPPPVVAPPPAPVGIDPTAMSDVKVELSDTTLPTDGPPRNDRTVLPFAGSAAPPPSAVGDVKAAIDALGQTRMDDVAPKAVTLPFKMPPGVQPPSASAPPLPSHLSGLNLEHYAALCAERDVYKGWEAQVEARYGIGNADDRQAVDAHFRAQLKADAAQMEAWRKHYARAEAWAREQRGS